MPLELNFVQKCIQNVNFQINQSLVNDMPNASISFFSFFSRFLGNELVAWRCVMVQKSTFTRSTQTGNVSDFYLFYSLAVVCTAFSLSPSLSLSLSIFRVILLAMAYVCRAATTTTPKRQTDVTDWMLLNVELNNGSSVPTTFLSSHYYTLDGVGQLKWLSPYNNCRHDVCWYLYAFVSITASIRNQSQCSNVPVRRKRYTAVILYYQSQRSPHTHTHSIVSQLLELPSQCS